MGLLRAFDGYTVGHIPRELNKDADRLSNVAIDAPTSRSGSGGARLE
jgi:hypothetical protein